MNDPHSCRVEIDLPAQPQFLHIPGASIRALLGGVEDLDVTETMLYNIELAVYETCTNVVNHAYGGAPGRIFVTLEFAEPESRLTVSIRDTGKPFDLAEATAEDPIPGQIGGYGLFLMHQLMDDVIYTPEPGNNRWQLIKQLQ